MQRTRMGIRRTMGIVVSLIISVYGISLAKAVPSFGYPIHSGNEHNESIRLGTPEFVLINTVACLEAQRHLQRIFR